MDMPRGRESAPNGFSLVRQKYTPYRTWQRLVRPKPDALSLSPPRVDCKRKAREKLVARNVKFPGKRHRFCPAIRRTRIIRRRDATPRLPVKPGPGTALERSSCRTQRRPCDVATDRGPPHRVEGFGPDPRSRSHSRSESLAGRGPYYPSNQKTRRLLPPCSSSRARAAAMIAPSSRWSAPCRSR